MVPRSSRPAALTPEGGAVRLLLIVVLLLAGAAAVAFLLVDRGGSSSGKLRIYDPGAGTPVSVGRSDVVSDSIAVLDTAEGWQLSFQLTRHGAATMRAVSAALSRAAQSGDPRAPRLAVGDRSYDRAQVIFRPAPSSEVGAAAVIQVAGLTCAETQRLAFEIRGGPLTNRVPCVIRPPELRPSPLRAKAITAGASYTCALTRIGGLECWGNDRFGQLGNGTISGPHQATPQPVPVSGLRRGVISISAGAQAACALLASGRVKCWGYALSGQLGPAQHASRPVPTVIMAVRSARAIAVGDGHACALVRTGVDCWGLDDQGQLGDDRHSAAPAFAHVEGLGAGIRTLSAGGVHTCAVTLGGRVFCWGFNGSGQLGDGTRDERARPVAVDGLDGSVVEIAAAGLHTCALIVGGTVECWGSNASGEIGGRVKESLKPRPVKGLPPVSAIAVGASQSCAVSTRGAVECWGSNGAVGGRRGGDVPVAIDGLAGKVVGLAVGPTHTCALLREGSVECWGQNDQGQLGDGRQGATRLRPARVGLGG